MTPPVHEEKPGLDKEAGEREPNEGKSVAEKLAEEQTSEGEIVGGPTSEELSRQAEEGISRNEGLETNIPTTKIHPRPLTFPGAMKNAVVIPPSVLMTKKIIWDLGLITYPKGTAGPKQELNVNSKKGKFM